MAKKQRGDRSGKGPHPDSWRARRGLKGRRKARGEKCPKGK